MTFGLYFTPMSSISSNSTAPISPQAERENGIVFQASASLLASAWSWRSGEEVGSCSLTALGFSFLGS